MEARGGLVAGSYNGNQLVRIRHDSDSGVSYYLSFCVFCGSVCVSVCVEYGLVFICIM